MLRCTVENVRSAHPYKHTFGLKNVFLKINKFTEFAICFAINILIVFINFITLDYCQYLINSSTYKY